MHIYIYMYIYIYIYVGIYRDIAIDIPYIEHLGYTCHSEWQKFRET